VAGGEPPGKSGPRHDRARRGPGHGYIQPVPANIGLAPTAVPMLLLPPIAADANSRQLRTTSAANLRSGALPGLEHRTDGDTIAVLGGGSHLSPSLVRLVVLRFSGRLASDAVLSRRTRVTEGGGQ
jgi:hypothetical protein